MIHSPRPRNAIPATIEAKPAVSAPCAAGNPNLNANERKVLAFLAEEYCIEAGFYSFAGIQAGSSLDRRSVRLACRSLKRKGLAQFATGLWTEDGEMRGSGYAATKDGVARAQAVTP